MVKGRGRIKSVFRQARTLETALMGRIEETDGAFTFPETKGIL
jgi:hypothetical protein